MGLFFRRKFKGTTYTLGDLSVDGKFFCNTIEDTVHKLPAMENPLSAASGSCPRASVSSISVRWLPARP